jgi:alkanesulfonate monooxygenase SsuD/methylene tetrahydromethanopterin reductase-like flavin-dependent oxidoreductase (luciferase family)
MGRVVVRIGIGLPLGPAPGPPPAGTPEADPGAVLDLLEDAGIDSVWLSEQVGAPQVDPFIGLAFTAARTRRLKLARGSACCRAGTPSW